MKKNTPYVFLFILVLLFSTQLFAQQTPIPPFPKESTSTTTTFSYYNSFNKKNFISSKDFPQQVARFSIDRPTKINQITLHLAGRGKGRFTCHIYGHESGTNYPALAVDLIPPIVKKKKRRGKQSITIQLKEPLMVTNDQFYIALDNFTGDFGLAQDSTYQKEFCQAKEGGNSYPTLLKDTADKWIGKTYYTTMDVSVAFAPLPPPIFKEITQAKGISLNHSNAYISWGDIDGDQWLDLLVGGALYKNKKGQFTNITPVLGSSIPKNIQGAVFIDMDNDGDQDILYLGKMDSQLYLNDSKGDFTATTIAIPPLPSLHAYSIADINKDQFPDLVLAQLWDPYPIPHPNYLLLNDGQHNFSDITKRLYPQHTETTNFPAGQACLSNGNDCEPNNNKNHRSRGTQFTDFDLDGDSDLYIANYFLESDEFYQNDGNGFFSAIPPPKPAHQFPTTDNHGTGVAWYDFDNDGDFDLLLPQLAHPRYLDEYDHRGTTLFRNDNGQFTDVRTTAGIEYEETHAGASFGDINNDGLVDLITTVFYDCRYIDVYLQQPNHTFKLSTFQTGLSKISTGNDACFVDFNNDGLLDVAMGSGGQFRLFENVLPNQNHWLKIQLQGQSIHHFGIGAIVKVHLQNGQILTQEVNSGRGQRMQKPTVLHFGLGKETEVEKVRVVWGKSRVEEFIDLKANQFYALMEGTGVLVVDK